MGKSIALATCAMFGLLSANAAFADVSRLPIPPIAPPPVSCAWECEQKLIECVSTLMDSFRNTGLTDENEECEFAVVKQCDNIEKTCIANCETFGVVQELPPLYLPPVCYSRDSSPHYDYGLLD